MTNDKRKYLNCVLDFIEYDGLRKDRNLNALDIILEYFRRRQETSAKCFDCFIKNDCDRIKTAKEIEKSRQYVYNIVSNLKFKLNLSSYINFINLGYKDGESAPDKTMLDVLTYLGKDVKLVGEENTTPIHMLDVSSRLYNLLGRKGFTNIESLSKFIESKGDDWYKCLYGVGECSAKAIEDALEKFKASR